MMNSKNREILVIMMALFFVFVQLLTQPSTVESASASAGEKVLIVAFPGTVEQIDPNYSLGSTTAQTVVSNIYDQLTEYETRISPDGYLIDDTEKIIGNVAESAEISPDGRKITYSIRKGLKFHDGTPLDGGAVKFTFDRIIKSRGIGCSYLAIAGARTPEMIELVDKNTVVVNLEKVNPLAMKALTLQNIVPVNPKLIREHATAEDPYARKWLSINAAGSGPFKLEKLSPSSEIILARNPQYWKGPAKLEKVIIKIVPNAANRILSLLRGAVDMIVSVPPKDMVKLDEQDDITAISASSRKFYIMGMNVNIPPLNKVKVRQAICYAVPYDTIINKAFHGYAKRLRTPVPYGTPTHTEKFWRYDTNLEKAKALLAEAGLANGFKTTLCIKQGIEEEEAAAVWIKSSLSKIGITVDIETLPLGAFLTKGRAKKHPMYINSHAFWVNDPFYGYYFLVRTKGPASFTEYSNAEVDKLISDFMTSNEVKSRKIASERIQNIVTEEAPFAYLAQANINVAMRKNVKNYYFSFDGTHVIRFYPMYKE